MVSLSMAGAIFGSLAAGPFSDIIGRKPILILSNILVVIGSLLACTSKFIMMLMIARFLTGIGIGMISLVLPIYMSELSPLHIRGQIIAYLLASHSMGAFLSGYVSINLGNNWRLMLFFESIPMFIQIIWILYIPESPRWLAVQNEDDKCLESLAYVYDEIDSEKQLDLIKYEMSRIEKVSYFGGVKQLLTTYRKCLIIGSTLRILKQCLGRSIFLQYGPEIMINAGRGIDDGQSREVQGIILSLPLTATNAVGSIIAIFTIEKIGRRKSMLYSIPMISFFLLMISIAMHLSTSTDNTTKFFGGDMLTFAMILYFIVISVGFQSSVETINTEIYPIHLIGTAQGISTAFNWLANFSMASIFLTVIENQTGIVIIFILMAGVGVLTNLFVYT